MKQPPRTIRSRTNVADIPHTSARLGRLVIDDSELWRIIQGMSESEMMQAALLLANLSDANDLFLLSCYLQLRYGSHHALTEISKSKAQSLPSSANLVREASDFQRRLAELIESLANASPKEIDALQASLFAAGSRVLLRPEFERVTTSASDDPSKAPTRTRTGIQIRRHQHLFADDQALLGFIGVLFAGRQLLGEQQLCRCRHCRQFFFLARDTGGRPRSRFCSEVCARSGKGLDAAERSRRYRMRKRAEPNTKKLTRTPRRAK